MGDLRSNGPSDNFWPMIYKEQQLAARLLKAEELLSECRRELIASGNWDAKDFGWPALHDAIDAFLEDRNAVTP